MLKLILLLNLLIIAVIQVDSSRINEWARINYIREIKSSDDARLRLSTTHLSRPKSPSTTSTFALTLFPCSEPSHSGIAMVLVAGLVDEQERLQGLVHLRRAQEQDRLLDWRRCVSLDPLYVSWSSSLSKRLKHMLAIFNEGQAISPIMIELVDDFEMWLMRNEDEIFDAILRHQATLVTHKFRFQGGKMHDKECVTMMENLLITPTPCLHLLTTFKSVFSTPKVNVIDDQGHVHHALFDHIQGFVFNMNGTMEDVIIYVKEGKVLNASEKFNRCFEQEKLPLSLDKWLPLLREHNLTEETASLMALPLTKTVNVDDHVLLMSDWKVTWRDENEAERTVVKVRVMNNVEKSMGKLLFFNNVDDETKEEFTGVFRLDLYNDETQNQMEKTEWTISSLEGVMVAGKVEGRVRIRSKDQKLILAWAKNGMLHGSLIVLGVNPLHVPKHQSVLSPGIGWFGVYDSGRPRGLFWKELVGGGLIHGLIEDTNKLFVYPDSKMGLFGQFSSDLKLIEAKEVIITKLGCEEGVLKPDFEYNEDNKNVYTYAPSTNISFGRQPHLKDPYDAMNVEVKPSLIEGAELGAFARRFLPRGRVIGFYDGLRQSLYDDEYEPYRKSCTMNETLSDDARRECTAYNINLSSWRGRLVIPPWLQHGDNYSATSIHRVNCGFDEANVFYADFDHPRLGLVQSVVALRDVQKGEELLVDYGYRQGEFPYDFPWYFKEKKLREQKRAKEEEAQA